MNKRDFFLRAMKAEEFRRRAWVISAFSLLNEGGDAWKQEAYPYRIVQMPTGHFFVDPEKGNDLTKIDDAKAGEPPFAFKDRIKLAKGDLPNVFDNIETNYGNVLANCLLFVYPFGHKIPFVLGRMKPRKLEAMILEKGLKDTPKEGAVRDDKFLYVDEYKKFADAAFSLVAYTQLCVPAATPKTLVPPEGIHELRDRLFEENKDRLHDPAVMAKIDAELVAFDRAWLKGDPGENYLITDKNMTITRKKQFGTMGAEGGLSEGINVNPIRKSLSEGWEIEAFPQMNDTLRAGSYNRGAQTMLGGESVKWLLRASSNINIKEGDCGATLGRRWDVTNDNVDQLIGFHLVIQNKPVHVPDREAAQQYLGKSVVMRSPQYCKLPLTDFCAFCVGDRLAANPFAAATAVAGYGSAFLDIYMQAGHGKKLTVAKFDWQNDIF